MNCYFFSDLMIYSGICFYYYKHILNSRDGYNSTMDNKYCLVLTCKWLYNHLPFGPVSWVKILVHEDREYVFHVLKREVEHGNLTSVSSENDFFAESTLLIHSIFSSAHWYDIKWKSWFDFIWSVCVTKEPFLRVDSVNCVLWVESVSTFKADCEIPEEVV